LILSSSLHGLIIANAFGRPAGWVRLSEALFGDDVKFQDYYASVGLERAPRPSGLPGGIDFDGLMEQAASSPCPDPSILVEKLFEACPFRRR
jgi:hypothetical protein